GSSRVVLDVAHAHHELAVVAGGETGVDPADHRATSSARRHSAPWSNDDSDASATATTATPNMPHPGNAVASADSLTTATITPMKNTSTMRHGRSVRSSPIRETNASGRVHEHSGTSNHSSRPSSIAGATISV